MRRPALAMLMAALAVTGACESDENDMTGPGGDATVTGRIEATVEEGASGAQTAPAAAAAAEAISVVVARLSGNSAALENVAEGTVDGGSYEVSGVPAGLSGLVVVALDAGAFDVGRAMVHGETVGEATAVVAPINAETTLEALVLASLRSRGFSGPAANTGGIDAFVRVGTPEALAIRASSTQLRATADGFVRSEASLTAAFEALDLDLDAAVRTELMTPLAVQFASQRNSGASLELAHEALVEAELSAWAGEGATDQDLALATAVAASGVAHASGDYSEGTWVAVTRQALALNLRARQRLATATAGGSAEATALANARVTLSGATTRDDVEGQATVAASTARAALTSMVTDLVSGLSLSVRLRVQGEVDQALVTANLSTRLQGRTSPESMAGILVAYRAAVEAAVEDVAAEIPAGIDFDAEAMVSLLIAAGASPWIS